nr:hypothetical protein [Pseudomonas sp.]
MNTAEKVATILGQRGPQLSTDLASQLVARYGMSAEAARQAISRTGAPVRRLKGIVFPHRARFLYLDTQYGMKMFSNNLLNALKAANHHCYFGLAVLTERGGILPKEHFKIASGSPKMQKGKVSAERLVENLVASNLARLVDVPGVGECIALGTMRDDEIDAPRLKARLVTETLALSAVRDWAKRLGVGAYNQVTTRDDAGDSPSVGPNLWDLVAPCYLFPVLGRSSDLGKVRPGSFVCDIYLGDKASGDAIEPFVRKCQNVRAFPKLAPVLQMFVADSYTSDAIKRIKSIGAMAATIETLLGTEVAQALAKLAQTLTSTAESARDPEKLDKLFETLVKIEGAASTLRGCLFEYVGAEIAREHYRPMYVWLNREIVSSSTGARAEIDVLVEVDRKNLVFIECKGHRPNGTVDEAEVEKWLNKRLPTMREFVKEHSVYKDCAQSYELWTNASLTQASKDLIAARQATTDKFQLRYREGLELLSMVEGGANKPLMKTYRQHFRNHPLSV